MRIQDFNPVIKEDNEMSDVITARGLVTDALRDPAARQEYFDYMTHLRNKHGKEYSTRIHQKATALAKSVTETIKKVGGEYELVSKSGKNLGKYPTRAGAEKRERQVNYFKHKDAIDEDAWTGDNPAWNNGTNQWNDGTDQWHSAGTGDASAAGATGGAAGPLGGAIPVGKSPIESDTEELEEDFNPKDVVSVDIPLLIRLLEYAREDAKTDMDLHDITERLIALSQEGNTLTMQDYDKICNTKETD